jgi:hypothetical protein
MGIIGLRTAAKRTKSSTKSRTKKQQQITRVEDRERGRRTRDCSVPL